MSGVLDRFGYDCFGPEKQKSVEITCLDSSTRLFGKDTKGRNMGRQCTRTDFEALIPAGAIRIVEQGPFSEGLSLLNKAAGQNIRILSGKHLNLRPIPQARRWWRYFTLGKKRFGSSPRFFSNFGFDFAEQKRWSEISWRRPHPILKISYYFEQIFHNHWY